MSTPITTTTTPTFSNYINGEWIESGHTFEKRNPANTDDLVALFSKGSAQDIAQAADAAAAAFPAWSSLNAPARGAILFKTAELLDRRFESIAADMTREEGKTLPEAKGEVRRAINIFRYFAGEGARLPGIALRARSRPHVRYSQTHRRGGPDHALEFPQRDSRLETGARFDLW